LSSLQNVVLFVDPKATGKDFVFFIRNLYILTAKELGIGMSAFVSAYLKKEIPDPIAVRGEQALIDVYGVWSDEIDLILKDKEPTALTKPGVSEAHKSQRAIGWVLRELLETYKNNK